MERCIFCGELRMCRGRPMPRAHPPPLDSAAARNQARNNGGLGDLIRERKSPKLRTLRKCRSHVAHSRLMERISGRIIGPRTRRFVFHYLIKFGDAVRLRQGYGVITFVGFAVELLWS